jgi:tetratricopeptide (TPR) repeat protein/DNA-binding CsgD family transcriptional regulator
MSFRFISPLLLYLLFAANIALADSLSDAIQKHRFELAHEQKDKDKQLSSSIQLADALIESEQYRDAKSALFSAEKSYLTTSDQQLKIDYCLMAGDIHHYLTSYVQADRYFKKHYELCKRFGTKQQQADAASAVSQNLNYLNRYDVSLEYAQIALNLYKSVNSTGDVADMKATIGWLLIIGEDWSKAEELILESLDFYQAKSDTFSMMLVYEDLAKIAENEGLLDSAFQLIETASQYFIETDDVDGIITSSFQLAELHAKTGQWEAVQKLMLELLDHFKSMTDQRDLHRVYKELGRAEMHLEQFEVAQHHIEQFMVIGSGVKEAGVKIDYHRLMQKLYLKTNRYTEAIAEGEELAEAQKAFSMQKQQQLIRQLNSSYETAEREKELLLSKERSIRLEKENELLEKDQALQQSKWMFRVLAISCAACLLLLALYIQRMRQKKKTALIQREKEQADAQLQLTEQQLKSSNESLAAFTQSILEKNALIEQFEAQLETHDKSDKKSELYNMKILTNEDWLQFRQLFLEVYPEFLNQLLTRMPDLTEGDQRFLLLLKLNIPTRQMADMLGVSQSSIRVSRHRIKKKIELGEDEKLADWLDQL